MQEKGLILAEMTWPEVAEVKDKIKMVLIPVGSIEQHGPNMTFITDTALVTEACRQAVTRLHPEALLAPTIPFGISYHHMDFPGSLTLHPQTLTRILTDVVRSLQHHGFQDFLIVNGHGGNVNHLSSDCVILEEELHPHFIGMCSYFGLGLDVSVGHAGKVEVSYGLHLAPHTVRRETLTEPDFTGWEPEAEGVTTRYPMKKRSRNGVMSTGGAEATEEYGKELAEAAIEGLAGLVKTLIEGKATLDT